jgi:putative SOS response-associated peptidase YedK
MRRALEFAIAPSRPYIPLMCNLYRLRKSPEEVRSLFDYVEEPDFPPRNHVAPLNPIAIVRNENGARHFVLVQWGLIPSWVKELKPGRPLTNARSESILEKPSFRHSIRRRRCLIPADGFYEWKGDVPGKKTPYLIERPDQGLFAFAGIWDHWLGADGSELETAAMITTEANTDVALVHDRMPVVIEPQNFASWLDVQNVDAAEAIRLLRPAPPGYFTLAPTVIERRPPPPKPIVQASLF